MCTTGPAVGGGEARGTQRRALCRGPGDGRVTSRSVGPISGAVCAHTSVGPVCPRGVFWGACPPPPPFVPHSQAHSSVTKRRCRIPRPQYPRALCASRSMRREGTLPQGVTCQAPPSEIEGWLRPGGPEAPRDAGRWRSLHRRCRGFSTCTGAVVALPTHRGYRVLMGGGEAWVVQGHCQRSAQALRITYTTAAVPTPCPHPRRYTSSPSGTNVCCCTSAHMALWITRGGRAGLLWRGGGGSSPPLPPVMLTF